MGMNTNNLGVNSSGDWAPMGAGTTSNGDPAGSIVVADAGLVSGVTNMGEKTLPVVSNATPPAGQSQTFSAPIKRAVFQFCDEVAAQAVESGLVLYIVFGALDDADAKTKLDTAGLRHIVPLNSGIHEFTYPDVGGPLRFDFATSAEGGADTLVAWEVTL